MTWSISVLSSSPHKVVVKAQEVGTAGAAQITWANLADLFTHPDTAGAPSAPQLGSVTGERLTPSWNKAALRIAAINSSHGHNTSRTSSISWYDGSTATQAWGLPTDPMDKDFSDLPGGGLALAGSIGGTDAVQLEACSGNMTATKPFDVLITFVVDKSYMD